MDIQKPRTERQSLSPMKDSKGVGLLGVTMIIDSQAHHQAQLTLYFLTMHEGIT